MASLHILTVACRQTASLPPAIRYDAHVSAGGAVPPAGSMTNPFRGDQPSAQEGEGIFVAMNCDGCHGGGAVGWVGPSLVDGRWRYGGVLSPAAIWKVVTYLQAQPVPKEVPTERWQ